MIGYRHVLTGYGGITLVQNLSSLTLDVDGIQAGMADEISSNNTVYTNSNCYKGSGGQNALQVFYPSAVDLYDYDTISFISYVENNDTIINQALWSFRDETTQSVQSRKTTGGNKFDVAFRDSSGVLVTINSLMSVYPGEFTKMEFRIEDAQSSTLTLRLLINDVEEDSAVYTKGVSLESTIFTIGNFTRIPQGIGTTGLSDRLYNTQIVLDGTKFGWYPLCENKFNADGDIAYDVINGNNAVLANAGANDAKQDYFHYLQDGFLNKTVKIPIKADGTTFADGTALTDPDAILQDGNSWLNDGSKQKQETTDSELIAADTQEVWYSSGVPKEVTHAEIEAAITNYPDIYGGDIIAGESIKNITLK